VLHQKVAVDDARISAGPITLDGHQLITGDRAAGLDLDLLSVPRYAGRAVGPLTKTLALQRKSPSVVVPSPHTTGPSRAGGKTANHAPPLPRNSHVLLETNSIP